jgi:hypothetical protein
MLYLSSKLSNVPLYSIRSNGRIGTVLSPIINPHTLHIDAFYCTSYHTRETQILLDMNVRDLSPRGIIIDDHVLLSPQDELVRLKHVLDLNYQLEDKPVLAGKKRIGKVAEYAIDKESLFVQKLYVTPPVWQNFQHHKLTIGRSSIIEITEKAIIVSGPEQKDKSNIKFNQPGLSVDYSASASSTDE